MGRTGRYVCIDCNRKKKGGYFSLKGSKNTCPYCGSTRIKRLGN